MGKREITIRESVPISIAKAAWFIESKGMVATAEKFSESVYDFIETLSDPVLIHAVCREPGRKLLGLKCKKFSRKYTIVFWETEKEIIICEFLPSKLIKW